MRQAARTQKFFAFRAGTVLAAVLLAAPAFAASISVTCGDSFRGIGHLTGDCAGTITIEKGILYLFGNTITSTGLTGIDCEKSCKVVGPGRIVGAGASFGILADGRVQLLDVDEVSGHSISGVRSGTEGVLRVENSHILANGTGLTGARVKITDSTVIGNAADGLVATLRGVKLKNCEIRGNGRDGVGALLDNVQPRRVRVVDSEIEDNMEFGIIARNIKMTRSSTVNNALSPDCYDTIACADIASIRAPKKDFMSSCGRSMQIPEVFSGPVPIGAPWVVPCFLDVFPP